MFWANKQERERERVDESVIFGGILCAHFGHFIIESLARIWYVLQNPKDTRRIAFLLMPFGGNEPKPYFSDFFRLLGIDEKRIFFVKKPTQFSHLTLPEECVHTWHSYSKEYALIYDTLAQNAQKECAGQEVYEKIYLTTKQYNGGARSVGEENFENFFAKLGFKVIAPEKFSIARQIHLIFNAKEIVSTLGSVAHLSLFAKKDTKQYILTRDYTSTLPAQIIITQAKKLDYIIINASANFLHSSRAWGPINLAFTPEFCEFVNDAFEVKVERNFGNIEQYIKAWCEYYEKNFAKIAQLDAFDFLSRLSREFCGKTLDRKNFEKILIPLKNPNSNQKCVGEFLSETLSTKCGIKPSPNAPKIELHFSNVGWINTNEALFKDKQLEAIKITNAKCDCLALVDGTLSSGELCGTTGQNKALRAFSIKLYGDFAIIYKIHDGKTWSRWFLNGERTSECEKIRGVKIAVLQREILNLFERALGDFKGDLNGAFKGEKKAQDAAKANESLSLKKHLGYKLGNVLAKACKTWHKSFARMFLL